jgi:PEP-CTERM putative exosortase interaction domain
MSKPGVLTVILSAVVFLTLTSSARADVVQSNMSLEKMIFAERHNLTVLDNQRAEETGYLYAAHFESNNGKHLGFSMAAFRQGPKLGIVRPQTPAAASQNPEPTAMVLLGTGLAAVAAFARRKNRRRS